MRAAVCRGGKSGMKKKILLIEDEETTARYLYSFFTNAGFTLVIAPSAADAIALVQTELPDIVLLDLQLPDVDGLTLLERMQKIQPELTVLILSGITDETIKKEALAAGAKEFVSKSATASHLLMLVDRAIKSKAV